MNSDEPTGRDIRTIWKTIAVVGGIIAALGALAIIVISWGSGQGETNATQTLRLDTFEKRLDAVERDARWHQRGHVPGVGRQP